MLALVGLNLGPALMGLLGLGGLLFAQFRSRLSWRGYRIALGVGVWMLLSLILHLFNSHASPRVLARLGLPAVAMLSGLFANGLWTKGQYLRLEGRLDDPESRALGERLGRRLWIPVVGFAGMGFLLLFCGWLPSGDT